MRNDRDGMTRPRHGPGTYGAFVGLATVALLATGAADALAQSKPDIRIATGRQGGAYYQMGAVVADGLYRTGKVASATAESSSGALQSARLMARGQIQLAPMEWTWVKSAVTGTAPFEQKIPLVTVAPLGVDPVFFIARDDTGIKALDDLKGKRIAIGNRGSGMANHARKILSAMGWAEDKDYVPVHLGFGAGGRAVREGKADAQLQCCAPNGSLTELSELAKVHTVDMSARLAAITAKYDTYGTTVMKSGIFRGHGNDMKVIGLWQGWMSTPDLPAETAHLIAQTFVAHLDDFAKKMPNFEKTKALFALAKTEGRGILEMGAPLHPGALKAYQEAGILK